MNRRHESRKRTGVVCALAAMLCAGAASGQVGSHLASPQSFITPSRNFYLGGRYTRDSGASIAPKPEAYSGGPLSVSMVPGMNSRSPASPAGIAGYGSTSNLGTLPSSLRPMAAPSAVPSARPLGQSFGSPLPQTSVPQYQQPVRTRNYGLFKPTVTADSISHLRYQNTIPLQRVLPKTSLPPGPAKDPQGEPTAAAHGPDLGDGVSPTAAAGTPAGSAAGAQTPDVPVAPAAQAEAVRNLSEIKSAQLNQEVADCLKRAMDAIKNANYRGTDDRPGAITLLRRARLLDDRNPDPVVGLLACYLATGDYHQASALVGVLARHWPDVLARQDLLDPYAGPEQMRSRIMLVRGARGIQEDPDLDLLVAFLRWFFESRQTASSEAQRLAGADKPDSSAAALAAAMRQAMATGGS